MSLAQFYIGFPMILLLCLGTIGLFVVYFPWVTNINRMCMLKVISLALLLLIRLQFPLDKFITYVLRFTYGNLVVNELRKYEKFDYSLRKCKLDLIFLLVCLQNNIISMFLNFCVSNSYLKSSPGYQACQIKLLKGEIWLEKSRIRTLEKDFNNRK